MSAHGHARRADDSITDGAMNVAPSFAAVFDGAPELMSAPGNAMIERLPYKERRNVLSQGEPVRLRLAEVLSVTGEPTRFVYFPIQGFLSLIATVDGRRGVEVGMAGREGMLGAHLALGVQEAPLRALVQGAGVAWRMEAGVFRAVLAESPALQQGLQRYLHVMMQQMSGSAACLRFHLIGPRLARWLLMSQDRAASDQLHITHEFLAYMLGVRRVGVTTAAGALQRAGMIEYRHGELKVLDRPRLLQAACSCYATDRRLFTELLL